MKKLYIIMLVAILAVCVSACAETVTLSCDAEGCTNTVEVEKTDDQEIDESWIVYCDECADKILTE